MIIASIILTGISLQRGTARQSADDPTDWSFVLVNNLKSEDACDPRHAIDLVLIVQALDLASDCVEMPVIYGR